MKLMTLRMYTRSVQFILLVMPVLLMLSLSIEEPPIIFRLYPPDFLKSLDSEHWKPCKESPKACKCRSTTAVCNSSDTVVLWLTDPDPEATLYDDRHAQVIAEGITTLLFTHDGHSIMRFISTGNVSTLYISSPFNAYFIEDIDRDFPNLKVLYLKLDREDAVFLRKLLNIVSLRELYIDGAPLDGSEGGWFDSYFRIPFVSRPLTAQLTTLSLDHSELKNVEMERLAFFLKNLTSLHFVQTMSKFSRRFPETCNSLSVSYFPVLEYLELDGNSFKRLASNVCLPNLMYLSLKCNSLCVIESMRFSDLRFPKLTNLKLKGVNYMKLNARAFSNPHLQSIDLSGNGIDFTSDSVNGFTFVGCPNLTQVNLENNVFKDISPDKLKQLFMSFESVLWLNLRSTGFSLVMESTFKPLKKVKNLLLNDNEITSVRDGSFVGLDSLTALRLDNNYITSLSEEAFGAESLGRMTILNLSSNHFECTCSLLWLHQRLASDPGLFDAENPYSRYECSNLPGILVNEVFINIQQCLLSHDAYVFIFICSTVLISTLTTTMLLYRYRWHIRLVLYEAFRGNPQARWRQRRPEEFQYDLFVSYDTEDMRWVIEHLIPEVEQGMGLRLCIHQRDFIPGKNIADNIVDCLAVSKRVVAIFSPNFAESQWCQFELEMCLSHVVDNDDVMIIIILQHVPSRDMSGAMIALLRTTTYIEWGEGPGAWESFWRRLALAVNDILPGTRR